MTATKLQLVGTTLHSSDSLILLLIDQTVRGNRLAAGLCGRPFLEFLGSPISSVCGS